MERNSVVNRHLLRTASVVAAGAFILAGCSSTGDGEPGGSDPTGDGGGGSSADATGEIEFLFWNWGPDAEPGWRSIADEFEDENDGVTIKLTPVAGDNWGSYLANAATMIAGGASPDMIYTATEGVKFLLQNDMIMPIDDLVEGDGDAQAILDDIAPNLVDGLRVDGSLYALPYAWNNMVIYYNTDRFAEEGIEPPSPDWTIEDFVETARALTEDADGDGTPERYGYTWASNELFPGIMPWVLNFGGTLTTEDLCSATLDAPDVQEAVEFLHGLVHVEKVSPAPAPLSEIFPMFQNGDVAMFGAGRWPLATLLPAGFEAFDIQLYPVGDEQITEFGVAGFPILKSSENPELAWKFAKFTSSPQIQQRAIGSQEAPATDIPALRSVADQIVAEGLMPPNSEIFYGSLDDGDAALVPAPAAFAEFESTIIRYTGLIMADEVSVADGLARAQQELETIVTCR